MLETHTPIRVLLYGAGAVGSIYAYLLTQAGCQVTVICRSNYDAVKANGFLIDSALYGKGLHVQPDVVRSIEEAAQLPGTFDIVIVTTKAFPESRASEKIAPVVTRGQTTIALIQNGIGIEDEYSTAFPDNPLLSCVVYIPVTQTSPGRIEMGTLEKLQVGTFPPTAYDHEPTRRAADAFVQTLKTAGSNVTLHPDIQPHRWTKLMLNASWNSICALTLSRDVAFLASSPTASTLVQDVMREIKTIAQTLGYTSVTEAIVHEQMSRARDRLGGPGVEPSMLVDVLHARRLEVEVILGNPLKIARERGIETPRLEILYVLTKALDQALALRKPWRSLAGDEIRGGDGVVGME